MWLPFGIDASSPFLDTVLLIFTFCAASLAWGHYVNARPFPGYTDGFGSTRDGSSPELRGDYFPETNPPVVERSGYVFY